MELVTPHLGLIFWMTISFGLVLFILKKFAWSPIMKMLNERSENIEKALRSADKAREEMANLTFSNEQLLKEAKNERDAMLRDARKISENIINEARTKAGEEARRIVETAKESIHFEKMAAITELKNQLAVMSIEIAEKIMRQELSTTEKHQEFVNKLVDEVHFN